MNLKDAYKYLESDESKSLDFIKTKYRSLSKIYHPDITRTGNEKKFIQMKDAWDIIQKKHIQLVLKTSFKLDKKQLKVSKAFIKFIHNRFYGFNKIYFKFFDENMYPYIKKHFEHLFVLLNIKDYKIKKLIHKFIEEYIFDFESFLSPDYESFDEKQQKAYEKCKQDLYYFKDYFMDDDTGKIYEEQVDAFLPYIFEFIKYDVIVYINQYLKDKEKLQQTNNSLSVDYGDSINNFGSNKAKIFMYSDFVKRLFDNALIIKNSELKK